MDLVKNLGRNEVSSASAATKRIYQAWRYLTNFNLPGKSRKNIGDIKNLEKKYGA